MSNNLHPNVGLILLRNNTEKNICAKQTHTKKYVLEM